MVDISKAVSKLMVVLMCLLSCGSLSSTDHCAARALQKTILSRANQEAADYVVFRGEISSLPPPSNPDAPVLTKPAVFFEYTVDEVLWGSFEGRTLHAAYSSQPPCGAPILTLHAKVATFCSLNHASGGYCANPIPASEENLAKVRQWIKQATLLQRKISISTEEAERHLIHKVGPTCPALSSKMTLEGDVVVHIVINRQGEIEAARVVSGHPMLMRAALNAVKQYHYNPFFLDGRAVRGETAVAIHFRCAGP